VICREQILPIDRSVHLASLFGKLLRSLGLPAAISLHLWGIGSGCAPPAGSRFLETAAVISYI